MKNRKRKEDNLTFSRAQVYLILGSVVAIAVLSFIIGRLVGGDGGGIPNETARLQQNSLLAESEVLEEMNRLEERLKKAAEISPVEKPVVAKPHENAEGKAELSFAEKLSGKAPDETEHEVEVKVKTIEKIERITIIPSAKGVEANIKKRGVTPVPVAKTDKKVTTAIPANRVRGEASPKKKTAKRPMVEPAVTVPFAKASLKKPEQKRIANPKYTIQVGSFPSEKSAKKLQIRLKNKGYGSYIKKVARLRSVWYRVCVGAFEKRREAEKILDKLKKKEHLEGIILNYKKPLL